MNGETESLLSFDQLCDAVHGTFIGSNVNKKNFFFSSVTTDSRNVCASSLFVPLAGEFQDGHKYVDQAVEKGATVVFISADENFKNGQKYVDLSAKNINLCVFAVSNTMTALQKAAERYVEKFPNLIKVGITGSSGKTTTKELVVSVLKQKFNVVYTQGNFNSETGLPLSVFNIRKEHECGVFEMGMNRKNEIAEIACVLKPKYAVITNVGTAHIGILGSRDNIAFEKRHIYEYIPSDGAAFIPAADDYFDFLKEVVKGQVVRYGDVVSASESHVVFKSDDGLNGTLFSLDGTDIRLKLSGRYNYLNALAAVAVGRTLGLSASQIKAGIEGMNAIGGRMETFGLKLKNGKKVQVIKDCYNANPDSMASVLEFCSKLEVSQKIYVLGDMLELGEKSGDEHKKIGQKLASSMPDSIVLFGMAMKNAFDVVKPLVKNELSCFYSQDFGSEQILEASSFILNNAKDNALILVKASRGLSLERVITQIAEDQEVDK